MLTPDASHSCVARKKVRQRHCVPTGNQSRAPSASCSAGTLVYSLFLYRLRAVLWKKRDLTNTPASGETPPSAHLANKGGVVLCLKKREEKNQQHQNFNQGSGTKFSLFSF